MFNVIEQITRMLNTKYPNKAPYVEIDKNGNISMDMSLPLSAWIEIVEMLKQLE